MQDLWEIIGRLITTKNLRHAVFSNSDLAKKNTSIPCGIEIDSGKYATLAGLLRTAINTGPVSFFALGELLRILPFRRFEQSVHDLAKLAPQNSDTRSTTFQTALGILTIDAKYRDQFRGFADLTAAQQDFHTMSQDDFDTLKNLILDKNGQYSVAATQMCNEEWDPICFGILVPYANTKQRHPVLAPPTGFLI